MGLNMFFGTYWKIWKLTTQNNAYVVEGNQLLKQNRYHLRRPKYSE